MDIDEEKKYKGPPTVSTTVTLRVETYEKINELAELFPKEYAMYHKDSRPDSFSGKVAMMCMHIWKSVEKGRAKKLKNQQRFQRLPDEPPKEQTPEGSKPSDTT